MPDIEPHLADDGVTRVSPPDPRTALFWDGTHWHVPRVDDHGRVQVRGEDQLHSFLGVLQERNNGAVSGAGGFRNSNIVPDGEIWVVTRIASRDATSPTTIHTFSVDHDGVLDTFHFEAAAFPAATWVFAPCRIWLDHNDYVQVGFTGSLAGDTCRVVLFGHKMSAE